jgi:hypothetical protein
MNHPCYRCGHSIEDGKAFCPECGAPQIRVILPEAPAREAVAGAGAAISDEYVQPVLHREPAAPLSSGSHDVKPCALAAAIALGLTFLGLNPFVAALGGGWLAVVLSGRRALGTLRPATGARLGAMSGLFLFGVSTLFETLAVIFLHKGVELRAQVLDKVQQISQRYPGPEVQPFLDFVKTPEGFAFMMAGSVIFALVAFIALGSAGGAIAASVMGRGNRRQQ